MSRLTILTLVLVLVPFVGNAEERVLGQQDGMVAVAGRSYNCQYPSVTVRSNDPSVFQGDRVELQRFIGLLRVAIGFECPSLDKLIITGAVGRKRVYFGQALASNGWQLVDVSTSGSSAGATIGTRGTATVRSADTVRPKDLPDSSVNNKGCTVPKGFEEFTDMVCPGG